MNVDDVIAAFIQLRSHKESVTKRHKEELAPINEQMQKCLAWIQQQLQNQGLTNFKAKSGIAFLQTDVAVKVQDWDAMFQWIKENEAWMFLEKRVSKSVVQEFMEANNEVPPGIAITTSVEAHIRQS